MIFFFRKVNLQIPTVIHSWIFMKHFIFNSTNKTIAFFTSLYIDVKTVKDILEGHASLQPQIRLPLIHYIYLCHLKYFFYFSRWFTLSLLTVKLQHATYYIKTAQTLNSAIQTGLVGQTSEGQR